MRERCFVTVAAMLAGCLLASVAANAQPATGRDRGGAARNPPSSERPVDKGPFTPEANRAYQGGGMILQGAPGAPAPTPEPTPPGQTPRNMVPPR